jgi:hypothetical protein
VPTRRDPRLGGAPTGNPPIMSDEQQVEREIGHGEYGPGVVDVPNNTRTDRGADDDGLSSTIPAGTDTEQLRDGGPTETPGVATTTGGTAGPNSFKTPPRSGPGVANTSAGEDAG